jgi:pilus assembly protein CpaC
MRIQRWAAAALMMFVSVAATGAQVPGFSATATGQPAAAPAAFERIPLTANRSRVLSVDYDITRIAITNPTVADAIVVTPREVLIDGKGSGTTSLIVWGSDRRTQYDVVVDPGVAVLEQSYQHLFPGEDIRVAVSERAVILSGEVSTQAIVLRAGEIATGAYPESRVINLLTLPGGTPSQQVMLQVRFAEVNRSALTELGINLFTTRDRFTSRSTTQQFAAPVFDDSVPGGLVFGDFLNLFFFDRQEGIGGVMRALQERGQLQSLAEPNLIAYNNQEASFLAGGEFPIPIVTGLGQVNVQFKEFGVRLNFTPRIAGDTIRLRVRPEVSALDFNSGIVLEGIRIPGLITRRAETDVELRDGQSFAIAGLLNNLSEDNNAAIPVLSKIPIIGNIFKSKSDRAEQTELLVLITPRLVRPLDPDEVPSLPTAPDRFLPPRTEEEGALPPAAKPPGGN